MNQELMDQDLADVPAQQDMPLGQAAAGAVPPPPHLDQTALLLDIDGTLLDLAPTPREVWVPPGLADTLGRLLMRTSRSRALVRGRS